MTAASLVAPTTWRIPISSKKSAWQTKKKASRGALVMYEAGLERASQLRLELEAEQTALARDLEDPGLYGRDAGTARGKAARLADIDDDVARQNARF